MLFKLSRLLRAGDVTVHPADGFSMALCQPHALHTILLYLLCVQMTGWLHYEVYLALNLFIKLLYTPIIVVGCQTPIMCSQIW